MGVPITLILGQKETLEDSIILRDMFNGVQEIVSLSKIIPELKKRLATHGPSLDRSVPTPAELAAAQKAEASAAPAAGAAGGSTASTPGGPQKLKL
jgi:hypothetical protein